MNLARWMAILSPRMRSICFFFPSPGPASSFLARKAFAGVIFREGALPAVEMVDIPLLFIMLVH